MTTTPVTDTAPQTDCGTHRSVAVETLIAALAKRGITRPAGGERFELASGMETDVFVDAKAAVCDAETLTAGAVAIYETAAAAGIGWEVVGGPERGAGMLAVAVALTAQRQWCMVSRTGDVHGAAVGDRRVLVVEDVASTGGSLLTAVDALAAAGGEIAGVVALVDRGAGAEAAAADRGLVYAAAVSHNDLGIEPLNTAT